jgi:hypothetical protein
MAAAIYPWRDAQTADMPPVRLNKEGDTLMPIYMTQPENSSTTQPGMALPLLTQHVLHPRRPAWLNILRQRFLRQPPQTFQSSDASLTWQAGRLVQREIASSAGCQGVTTEVEQGVVTLSGSVDATWRKERLAALIQPLPGVKQLANHLFAQDKLASHLHRRFQELVTAGTLDHLPKLLVENQIGELYGEVATSEQRKLLEREALAVPGVRVVINHLSVPQELDPQVHTTNR